jgi:hypothetical protein
LDELAVRDIYHPRSRNLPGNSMTQVVRHGIKDRSGVLVAIHARRGSGPGKQLWWENPDGSRSSGEIHSADLPLYRTERLAALRPHQRILVTEGEPAADALIARGIDAVATVTGAGAIPCSESLKALLSFDVVLWPDNDDSGRLHMETVGSALTSLGVGRVRTLSWPAAPVRGDAADFTGDNDELGGLIAAAREYEPQPLIDGVTLSNSIRSFLLRFVVLSDCQADACSLWVLHTHAIDAADCTPYLNIRSAEKQSGKTRLLEVLECLVARSWRASYTTTAALMRSIDSDAPTLLLDEMDAATKADREYGEALRGMLNAGFRRGGSHRICDTGRGNAVRDFSVFCPKAIAGIGDLPDTVRDRSIPIDMKRRTAAERVERFQTRKTPELARPLHDACSGWAAQYVSSLRDMAIDLPEWLSDRAADGWEPIFAIARAVGGDWLDRALAAARELSAGDAGEDASMGVTLLRDIREIFREKAADRLFTEELLVELNAIEESPWGNWYGRPMTGQGLAKLLRPFQIKPKQVRIGSDTKKGYELDWFRDNFARYLREPETPETPETRSAERTEGAIGNVSDVSLVSHPRGRRQEPPGHLTRYAQQLGLRIVGR